MERMVSSMDTPFLTIGEAAEKTGRSSSTIRRLIRTVADTPSHPDREGIEPTPAQVEAFKKKGENFTWKIREDLLVKNLKGAQKQEKKSPNLSYENTEDILQILSKELDVKTRQIEKQWEVIHALNDRLREGNILMGSLQQRLALPLAPSTNSSAKESSIKEGSSEVMQSPSKKAHKEAHQDGSMKESTKATKKGIFSWLRR